MKKKLAFLPCVPVFSSFLFFFAFSLPLPAFSRSLAVQPIALIAKIEAGWNDLPLLVKQMEHANGTHRITRCKSAIAHYFKIKGYHCRRRAELTFCAAT